MPRPITALGFRGMNNLEQALLFFGENSKLPGNFLTLSARNLKPASRRSSWLTLFVKPIGL